MYLSNFKINKVYFSVNNKFKSRKSKPVLIHHKIAMGSKYSKKNKVLTIFLKVSFTEGNIPFFVDVESEGNFSFDEAPDNKMLKQLSSINCPAIIFPYVRETIADLTRRSGYPPFHLQSVNFVELARTRKPKKKIV